MRLLKRFLSLGASALAVLLVSGFLSLQPIAESPVYAQVPADCADITMAGIKTLTDPFQEGKTDSGQLDFNQPDISYQACLNKTPKAAVNPTIHTFNGWAWNTNLGYISFSCQGGTNLGAACGAQKYESVYIPSQNKLMGFAWGDNIGWISIGCEAGTNMGTDCGAQNYGVKVAAANGKVAENCGPMAKGDLYGYAWTQSVGWINFCGAHVTPFSALTADVTLTQSAVKIYANNSDAYSLNVTVKEAGVPVGETADRRISFSLIGEASSLKSDQVTIYLEGPGPEIYNGIVQSGFLWTAATSTFENKIKSVAPTNATNVYKIEGVRITIKDASGITLQEIEKPLAKGFEFLPPVEVTSITSLDAAGVAAENVISTVSNASQEVRFSAAVTAGVLALAPANIHIVKQLYDCSDSYNFVFDTNGDGIQDPGETPIVPNRIFPQVNRPDVCPVDGVGSGLSNVQDTPLSQIGNNSFVYTYSQPDGTGAPNESGAVAVQTIVSFNLGGRNVRYLSKKTNDGSVMNQAADIKGGIRMDIFDTSGLPAANKLTQSLGEYAQSKRTLFNKAIKTTVSGLSPLNNAALVNVDANTINNAKNNILYYKRVGAVPCTVILDDAAGKISLAKPVTIVADGCNVYIDTNIKAQAASKGRLGIIALENFTLDVAGKARGGNAYICGKVTDVETNFVLDGSLFPYGAAGNTCGGNNAAAKAVVVDQVSGYPVFGANPVRDILKNQLIFIGSIIANNTYGGSLGANPVMGDGTKAAGKTEIAASRWYDLNFFRYTKTVTGVDKFGDFTYCWASDVSRSSKAVNDCTTDAGQQSTNSAFNSIITIEYRPPSSDMPVFSSVK